MSFFILVYMAGYVADLNVRPLAFDVRKTDEILLTLSVRLRAAGENIQSVHRYMY